MKDLITLIVLIILVYVGPSLLIYIEKRKSKKWCVNKVNNENTYKTLFTNVLTLNIKQKNPYQGENMRVDFIIPSAPVPKSRPRFNTNTGRAFTDNKTRVFENIVSLAYGTRHYFDDSYIRIRMKFKFEIPKSYSKKKRIEALEGKIRPTKADIDNYIKSVLDGLNGRAFKDDRYVYAVLAEKEYSEEVGIEVSIESI